MSDEKRTERINETWDPAPRPRTDWPPHERKSDTSTGDRPPPPPPDRGAPPDSIRKAKDD